MSHLGFVRASSYQFLPLSDRCQTSISIQSVSQTSPHCLSFQPKPFDTSPLYLCQFFFAGFFSISVISLTLFSGRKYIHSIDKLWNWYVLFDKITVQILARIVNFNPVICLNYMRLGLLVFKCEWCFEFILDKSILKNKYMKCYGLYREKTITSYSNVIWKYIAFKTSELLFKLLVLLVLILSATRSFWSVIENW